MPPSRMLRYARGLLFHLRRQAALEVQQAHRSGNAAQRRQAAADMRAQREEDVKRLRSHGLTWRQVGAWLHIDADTAQQSYMRAKGLASRRCRERALRAAELKRLGMTCREVGARLGVNRHRAHALIALGKSIATKRASVGMI